MSIKILRTACGCMAAIGLIKELVNRGVEVICADANPLSVGLYYCKKGYVIPKGDDPSFIPKVLEISKKEHVNAILSGPEEEIIQIAKNKSVFLKEDIIPLVPEYESALICFDKFKTYNFFIKNNIPTPKTIFLIKEEDKNNLKLDGLEFPVILKPRFGRGSKGVYIVNDNEELKFIISKYCKDSDYLIQEFVRGVECTIDVFSDLKGNPLSIVPRKRLAVESGIATKSQTFYNKKIINYIHKITEKLKLIGPSNIQCIIDEKEGTPRFIEINPRFGGGSILSIKADPTIIENLIRIVKGEKPIPSNGFREGLIMLRYYSEVYILDSQIIKGDYNG